MIIAALSVILVLIAWVIKLKKENKRLTENILKLRGYAKLGNSWYLTREAYRKP